MARTLTILSPDSHGGPPTAPAKEGRWGASGKVDPVAAELARRIGKQPKTCQHLLREVAQLLPEIVQAFYACEAELRFARWIEAFDRARAGKPVLALSEYPDRGLKLFVEEQVADGDEDVADTWFNRDQSDANLALAIRQKRRHIAAQSWLLSAMVAEQERRVRP